VRLTDGRVFHRRRDVPVGAAGADTRRRHAQLVRAKFLAQGGRPEVAEGLLRVADASPAELAELVRAALA
jgi:hypothetical protein